MKRQWLPKWLRDWLFEAEPEPSKPPRIEPDKPWPRTHQSVRTANPPASPSPYVVQRPTLAPPARVDGFEERHRVAQLEAERRRAEAASFDQRHDDSLRMLLLMQQVNLAAQASASEPKLHDVGERGAPVESDLSAPHRVVTDTCERRDEPRYEPVSCPAPAPTYSAPEPSPSPSPEPSPSPSSSWD